MSRSVKRCLLPAIALVAGLAASAGAQDTLPSADPAADGEIDELMAGIQAKVRAMDEVNAHRDQALKVLTKQVHSAMLSLAGERDHNESLQRANADLELRIDDLLQSQEALNTKLSSVTTERNDTVAALEGQVVHLSETLSREQQTTADLKQAAAQLNAKLDITSRENEILSGDLARARLAILADKETIAAKEQAIAKLNTQLSALEEKIGELATALEGAEARRAQQEAKLADLDHQLKTAQAGNVQQLARYRSEFFGRLRQVLGNHSDIRIVGDRFVFQSEILFESGSADLGDVGKTQLTELARTLMEISARIPEDIDWVLRVDGHTDSRPISTPTFPSNWELSAARAISVVKFLSARGLPARRLAATGFGEFRPLDPAHDEIAYRRNRRIEFKVTQK